MNSQQLNQFKMWFEAQRNAALANNTNEYISAEFGISKDDTSDETDLASVELEQSMRMRLKGREVLFLKKIEEALGRIKEGTFGECLDCGDEIDARRLEARPTATSCVTCKEAQEHSESIFAAS